MRLNVLWLNVHMLSIGCPLVVLPAARAPHGLKGGLVGHGPWGRECCPCIVPLLWAEYCVCFAVAVGVLFCMFHGWLAQSALTVLTSPCCSMSTG